MNIMAASVLVENLGNDHTHVVSISLFVAVLCLCIVIGHLLEENRWVNESITAILITDEAWKRSSFMANYVAALALSGEACAVCSQSVSFGVAIALLIDKGCITGAIILLWSKGRSSHILRFDAELFFIYLLPPIIFNAGFQVKKKQFFHNFLTIMLFGVVGVFISSIIISSGSWWLFPKIGFDGLTERDYLAIGTIFSSTDAVCTLQVLHQDETPLLYSLVFGEGVVNDATSVVLFNAIQKLDVSKLDGRAGVHVLGDFLYLFSTSTVLGIVTGLLTAYALKALYFGRHSTDREIALMVLMAYLSYMLAEVMTLNLRINSNFIQCDQMAGLIREVDGRLHILLDEISVPWHALCDNRMTILLLLIFCRHAFATMSFVAETFIFLYVGMDALDIEKWKMSKSSFRTTMGICSSIILLLSLGRAAFVFPLSALSNYMSNNAERTSITFKHQIIIWWAGLMRGAVSIALAFKQVLVLSFLFFLLFLFYSFLKFTCSGIILDPVHATMVTNTVIVVLFTTLVFGFLTKPLINVLLPHHAMDDHDSLEPDSPKEEDLILPLLSFEESTTTNFIRAKSRLSMLIERPVYTIHFYWRKFDDAYMRPVFGGPSSA
ncbi:hypothetical protein HHK36_003351 [Tetracentron sinense]|uniref:Cation/H+ exchanger transmembrane domain-containing protein n=1 Tax=Tetracentron sinense TaxID=13715 RepID=A0A834ZNJ9_TETSI|nr:hypothetical protein HHK36_003351 [Tetracentron sinense]